MKFDWLNRKNNKDLIVFFNGWGSIYPSKLQFSNFDLIMFHDYKSFEPITFDFSNYERKYLIAWSLGVFVCNFYFDIFKNFNRYTAINGTQIPIDDNFGIPVNAYNLTIDNFNELTCKKFIKKIGDNLIIYRNIDDLKQELISIKNLKPTEFFKFNKVIISKNDKIFPYKNLKAFWENKSAEIIELNALHYVFNLYKNWDDLI